VTSFAYEWIHDGAYRLAEFGSDLSGHVASRNPSFFDRTWVVLTDPLQYFDDLLPSLDCHAMGSPRDLDSEISDLCLGLRGLETIAAMGVCPTRVRCRPDIDVGHVVHADVELRQRFVKLGFPASREIPALSIGPGDEAQAFGRRFKPDTAKPRFDPSHVGSRKPLVSIYDLAGVAIDDYRKKRVKPLNAHTLDKQREFRLGHWRRQLLSYLRASPFHLARRGFNLPSPGLARLGPWYIWDEFPISIHHRAASGSLQCYKPAPCSANEPLLDERIERTIERQSLAQHHELVIIASPSPRLDGRQRYMVPPDCRLGSSEQCLPVKGPAFEQI